MGAKEKKEYQEEEIILFCNIAGEGLHAFTTYLLMLPANLNSF